MTVRTFRKKPVVIEAAQWTGDNEAELIEFTNHSFEALDAADRAGCNDPDATAQVYDALHSTWVLVLPGQWVIRGVKGEFYPINEDVLAETYDPVLASSGIDERSIFISGPGGCTPPAMDDATREQLAARVCRAIVNAGTTLEQIAAAHNHGYGPATPLAVDRLRAAINGERSLGSLQLAVIADATGTTVMELLGQPELSADAKA